MSDVRPIAITPGEPAGIGPDLVVTLAHQGFSHPIVVIADPQLLIERTQQLGFNVQVQIYHPNKPISVGCVDEITVLPISLIEPVQPGILSVHNAHYVLATLHRAAQGCLQQEFAALVTGPVHKGIINDAGIVFSGHTEYLAEQSGVELVVMMLATDSLRVALVTTHIPLSAVSAHITKAHVTSIIEILYRELQTKYQIASPRLLIAGLNPHAGENGHLGKEELEIITPVIQSLQQRYGWDLVGPLPADTLFTPRYLNEADAVLTMYHDQGLPVLKYSGFGHAANITLGLPFIRTSVDHGTALDLAGTGKADCGSLQYALDEAVKLVEGC